MPATEWGWNISPEEFSAWMIEDSHDLAVLNKPGSVVCHPSKHGPWSSLIGAAREYFEVETIHMPFRLDRETSGVWLAAKTRERGVELQRAVQFRQVTKTYLAIVEGELKETVDVDQPIGKCEGSRVWLKQGVRIDGSQAHTRFEPVSAGNQYSLVRVIPSTGRLHQIRVHAAWLGHPLVGDKIYGPDESLFVDFITQGYSGRVAEMLPLPRQALHCESVEFALESGPLRFSAPLPADLSGFCQQHRIAVPYSLLD